MLTENTRGALKICGDFGGTSAEGASGAPTISADFGVRVFFAGPCKSISRQKHDTRRHRHRDMNLVNLAKPIGRGGARASLHTGLAKPNYTPMGHRGGQYYPPGVQLCNSVSCRAAGHHGPGNFGHKPKHPLPTQLTLPPHHHAPLPAPPCASSTAQCPTRATRPRCRARGTMARAAGGRGTPGVPPSSPAARPRTSAPSDAGRQLQSRPRCAACSWHRSRASLSASP